MTQIKKYKMLNRISQFLVQNGFVKIIPEWDETSFSTKEIKNASFFFVYDPDVLLNNDVRRVYDKITRSTKVKFYFTTLQEENDNNFKVNVFLMQAASKYITFPATSFKLNYEEGEDSFAIFEGSSLTSQRFFSDPNLDLGLGNVMCYTDMKASLDTIAPRSVCLELGANHFADAIQNKISLGKALILSRNKKDFIGSSIDRISDVLKYKLDDGEHINNAYNINFVYRKKQSALHKSSHFWIYGSSNVGKSTMIDAIASMYNATRITPNASTHLGITRNTQIVCIDELAPANKFTYTTLNELADNSFKFKILYTDHFAITDYIVIIASNYHINEIYHEPIQQETLHNRYKVICLDALLEKHPQIKNQRMISDEQREAIYGLKSLECLPESMIEECLNELTFDNLTNELIRKNRKFFSILSKRSIVDVKFKFTEPVIENAPERLLQITDSKPYISSYTMHLKQAVFGNYIEVSKDQVAEMLSLHYNKRWLAKNVSETMCEAMRFFLMMSEENKPKKLFSIESNDNTKAETKD